MSFWNSYSKENSRSILSKRVALLNSRENQKIFDIHQKGFVFYQNRQKNESSLEKNAVY
jgi:phage pi2 protein 07